MSAMITVRLSADLHERFRALAHAHEVSMNELAVQLINTSVTEAEAKGLRHRIASRMARKAVADDLSDPVSRSFDPNHEAEYSNDSDSKGVSLDNRDSF